MVWVACFRTEQMGIACERARLPHLWGEPFALHSPEDGMLMVVSPEAERWGVAAGQTTVSALSLCPDLILLPYDRAAYEVAARSLWDVLAVEGSVVEPVSPEMAFVELKGDGPDVTRRAQRLAGEIAARMGVPLQVGLGRSKFVAEQAAAATMHCPSGEAPIITVPLGEEAAFLAGLPLSRLPRLDRKTRISLERLGVGTLGDLLALGAHHLPKALRKIGHTLLQLAHGYDSDPVRPLWPPPTITETVDFEDETCDRFLVENALLRLSERLARVLATSSHGFCREVTLQVGLSDGTYLTESERLALPASQVPPLFRAATRLISRMSIEQPVLCLQIALGELGTGSAVPLSLLGEGGDPLPHERRARLDAALTYLRRRFGARVVVTGHLLHKARRIHLWTFPLGHLLDEPVRVATNHRGIPVRYWRQTRRRRQQQQRAPRPYEIIHIQNRWRETRWSPEAAGGGNNIGMVDTDVWRVETDPWGLSELHHLQAEWRITGVMD